MAASEEPVLFNQRDEFYNKLSSHYEVKPGKKIYSKEQQRTMIKEIKSAKMKKGSKTRREYFLLQTYDVLTIKNEDFLIKKNKDNSPNIKYIISYEDLYVYLHDIHVNSTRHGGHLKMRQASKNFSVPRPAIECFLATCEFCTKKKSTPRKITVSYATSEGLNEKGQVDFIDFQSSPDGPYKWILKYQDHSTKFISLRALENNTAPEVAKELLQIFLTFGAPKVLWSDNGREFVNQIVSDLKKLWSDCEIISETQSQNLESDECCNQDVESTLKEWMTDNDSKNWSVGIQFVQWQKNTSHHTVIGKSPYKALFGSEPREALASSRQEPLDPLDNTTKTETLFEIRNAVHSVIKELPEVPSEPEDEIVTPFLLTQQEIDMEITKPFTSQKRSAEPIATYSKQQKCFENDSVLEFSPVIKVEPPEFSNTEEAIADPQNEDRQLAMTHEGWFGHDNLHTEPSNCLVTNENNTLKLVSIHEAVTTWSQEYIYCACKPSKTQCDTKRCSCVKKKTRCSSRCHTTLACLNS